MNVIDFFQGIFSFPVAKEMIVSAMYQRGYEAEVVLMNEISEDDQELILADLLVMLSRVSQGYTNTSGSDAFSMTIKGEYIPLADRQAMRREANEIYKRHKEDYKIKTDNAINIY